MPASVVTPSSCLGGGCSTKFEDWGNGQWAMGNGQWAMGNGQWAMGNGQWAMGNGQWAIEVRMEVRYGMLGALDVCAAKTSKVVAIGRTARMRHEITSSNYNTSPSDPADNPTTLRDVTGVDFAWICTKKNGCSVGLSPSTPPPEPCSAEMTPAYSYDYARFFHICSVCANIEKLYWTTGAPLCRLVACETSNDCLSFLLAHRCRFTNAKTASVKTRISNSFPAARSIGMMRNRFASRYTLEPKLAKPTQLSPYKLRLSSTPLALVRRIPTNVPSLMAAKPTDDRRK